MTAAPRIDDRGGGVSAHFARAENVPAGFADERRDGDFVRARRFERFLCAL